MNREWESFGFFGELGVVTGAFFEYSSLLLPLRFDFIETWGLDWVLNTSCMLYGLYDYWNYLVLLVKGEGRER